MREVKIMLKDEYISHIRSGNPILEKRMFVNTRFLQKEGDILKIVNQKEKFLARGYYGIQNKGCGWVLTRQVKQKIDSDFFKKTINAAISRRNHLLLDDSTNAYRVFNGEGDGIGGLTIDYYDGYYLVQWYSKGIYKFRDEVINTLKKRKPIKGIFQKKRFGNDGKYIEGADFILGEYPEWPLVVQQDGIKYAVNLDDGAMTGIFLDQRQVRLLLKDKYSKDKSVLNTFSYTGAFGAAAALGGASLTTNVDLAKRSVEKTKEMYEVNDIDLENHQIIVEDVFKYFGKAAKAEKTWDVVVLDPPSFSRSKNFTFSAEKDYGKLLEDVLPLVNEKGIVIASTNSSKMDMEKFRKQISAGFYAAKRRYRILETLQLPDDFAVNTKYPNSNYLKVLILKVD